MTTKNRRLLAAAVKDIKNINEYTGDTPLPWMFCREARGCNHCPHPRSMACLTASDALALTTIAVLADECLAAIRRAQAEAEIEWELAQVDAALKTQWRDLARGMAALKGMPE